MHLDWTEFSQPGYAKANSQENSHLLSYHTQQDSLGLFLFSSFFNFILLIFFDLQLPLQVLTLSVFTASQYSTLNKGFGSSAERLPSHQSGGWRQSWVSPRTWRRELPSGSLVLSDSLPIVQSHLSHLWQNEIHANAPYSTNATRIGHTLFLTLLIF